MNTEEIIEGYLGNTEVNSIYQGSELVWPVYFGDKIYVGGDFTRFNGNTQNALIRLNLDGTKDTSFNIDTGFNDRVEAINIDRVNSKIYVGGGFTTYKGSTQNRLIRLNMNGTKDTSFNIGTGFDGSVEAINIDRVNSKIYVGGEFTTYNGSTQKYIVRLNLDGSLDNTFNIGSGFNSTVTNIKIDNINQKIYVVGDFTTFQGVTQRRLIRLNMDGSKDTSFNIGTGFNDAVYALNIDTINQKIYAGGWFTTFNGGAQNRLIRLNMDGTKDNTFNIGTGFDKNITAINIDTVNSKIYVFGRFYEFNGSDFKKTLVKLNMNGSLDTSFHFRHIGYSGFYGYPHAFNLDIINQKLYVGGVFETYDGSTQNRLVRLNMDGSKDTSFNIGTGFNLGVYTILKYTE